MILHAEYPSNRLRQLAGAVFAYLANCARIADSEVARFRQLGPTRLRGARRAKFHVKKARASGPDQPPPREDRSLGGC
jgi:hypothetical protein